MKQNKTNFQLQKLGKFQILMTFSQQMVVKIHFK